MDHQALAHAAAVVGAFGACGLLLARERLVFFGGLAALVAAEAGLAYALVPDAPRLLTASAARAGALGAAVLVGLALAAVFVRYPAAAPVAILVVAPFRLSVGLGSQEAFLLIPLYGVLAAATVALAYRVLVDEEFRAVPYLIAGPTAALVALAGISLNWAKDPRAGTIELVFFYFPFTVLLSIFALTRTRDWTWRALATAVVAVTSLFAAIGLYHAGSHTEILAKQDVQLANAYSAFFRVTSVFQDPSVYGRHLVLGIVVLVTALWLALVRPRVGLPVLGLLVLGLYFSYSQTSFVSLFCAVLVISLVAGDRLTRRVVIGVSAALVLAAGIGVLVEGGGDSARQVTSDRLPLARVTLPVYTAHPVVGVGIGSQPLMSRREEDARKRKSKNVSHTTPLTVAAELGTIGLLAYLAFLAGLGWAIFEAWSRHRALGLALAGCLTALVVQSLFYGGFFEDPSVWAIAGVAAAALNFLPARSAGPG
jgi:O-antigen ligase/polysaccharide polymerase Wzy-like membrane protein